MVFFSFFKRVGKRQNTLQKRELSFPIDSEHDVIVYLRPNDRARSLRLSMNVDASSVTLTYPSYVKDTHLYDFLQKQSGWIRSSFQKFPRNRLIHPGDSFYFLGELWTMQWDPLRKKGLWQEGRTLILGKVFDENVHTLLTSFLKKEALSFFSKWSMDYARRIGASFQKVSVRDGRSRWGSCSTSGTLSYSWRLGLAPMDVALYVCAHEVAHLKEMNHGPEFWKWVGLLSPSYKGHRAWLKKEGYALRGIRFTFKDPC